MAREGFKISWKDKVPFVSKKREENRKKLLNEDWEEAIQEDKERSYNSDYESAEAENIAFNEEQETFKDVVGMINKLSERREKFNSKIKDFYELMDYVERNRYNASSDSEELAEVKKNLVRKANEIYREMIPGREEIGTQESIYEESERVELAIVSRLPEGGRIKSFEDAIGKLTTLTDTIEGTMGTGKTIGINFHYNHLEENLVDVLKDDDSRKAFNASIDKYIERQMRIVSDDDLDDIKAEEVKRLREMIDAKNLISQRISRSGDNTDIISSVRKIKDYI